MTDDKKDIRLKYTYKDEVLNKLGEKDGIELYVESQYDQTLYIVRDGIVIFIVDVNGGDLSTYLKLREEKGTK
ncbi:MAG: hypothetical protein J6R99_01805 [Alphaproteobacteria bacterium]|nr:hypothetical protein [Alphaproteobacteria bacterium]